ncbi:hypothetical protein SRHO_G00000560 [Serrasalmus rhombeus]
MRHIKSPHSPSSETAFSDTVSSHSKLEEREALKALGMADGGTNLEAAVLTTLTAVTSGESSHAGLFWERALHGHLAAQWCTGAAVPYSWRQCFCIQPLNGLWEANAEQTMGGRLPAEVLPFSSALCGLSSDLSERPASPTVLLASALTNTGRRDARADLPQSGV